MSTASLETTSRPRVLLVALFVVPLTGFAGTKPATETGKGGAGNPGGGGAPIFTGIGGTIGLGGSGPGNGGRPSLPIPPGCGDGLNNQGGIEDCDDGNTTGGDGCNGACHVE